MNAAGDDPTRLQQLSPPSENGTPLQHHLIQHSTPITTTLLHPPCRRRRHCHLRPISSRCLSNQFPKPPSATSFHPRLHRSLPQSPLLCRPFRLQDFYPKPARETDHLGVPSTHIDLSRLQIHRILLSMNQVLWTV